MGKSKKRNRRQALHNASNYSINSKKRVTEVIATNGDDGIKEEEEEHPKLLNTDAIKTTIQTLNYLSKLNPNEFNTNKEYKELRRAMHPLIIQQLQSYDKGIDYRQKVTYHLSKHQWSCALAALQGVKDYQQVLKQGTVQRWVRFMDECNDGPAKIKLLGCILSSSGSASNNKHDPEVALISTVQEQKCGRSSGNDTDLNILDGWRIPSSSSTLEDNNTNLNRHIEDDDDDDLLLTLIKDNLKSKVIYSEKGSDRKPPNHYDLLLHTLTEPSFFTTRLSFFNNDDSNNNNSSLHHPIVKHDIPFVKGGFVLTNVLTPKECTILKLTASTLGYRPDHPISIDHPTGIDSCEWLIDDHMHSTLFQRVKDHLPLTMGNSNSKCDYNNLQQNQATNHAYGINRRWRSFRYAQGCVYRPHIDGSWPESYISIDKNNDTYKTDQTGTTKSYLTLLMYLNDNFDGGETRFYYPDDTNDSLVARGIIPKMGSALIFPQGNTASLLHEGSPVLKGMKYVIRTDVLYKNT